MSRAASRVPSKSSSSAIALRRAGTNLPWNLRRFACSFASRRLSCARALKCTDPPPMVSLPQWAWGTSSLASKNFGDVQDFRARVADTPQPSFDVQHAAEVAENHCVGAGRLTFRALVAGLR